MGLCHPWERNGTEVAGKKSLPSPSRNLTRARDEMLFLVFFLDSDCLTILGLEKDGELFSVPADRELRFGYFGVQQIARRSHKNMIPERGPQT